MELTAREKILKAASFLRSSPPGEIDDVFNDIRGIINDDHTLQKEIAPILSECNTAQFYSTTIKSPDADAQENEEDEGDDAEGDEQSTLTSKNGEAVVLLTDYNKIESGEFIDYDAKLCFDFDHLRLQPKNIRYYSDEVIEDEFRDLLQVQASQYQQEHYPGGYVKVFPHTSNDEDSLEYVVCIISNKYNPDNFWNGRYQATWKFNPDSSLLTADLKINVHYYEDGNVQLNVENKLNLEVPQTDYDLPKTIFTIIAASEKQFQQSINSNYSYLNDNTFKDIRRKLPLTRTKVDWLKIASYNLNDQLSAASI